SSKFAALWDPPKLSRSGSGK
nr:Chain B, FxxLW motif peptide [synthetic construct]